MAGLARIRDFDDADDNPFTAIQNPGGERVSAHTNGPIIARGRSR